MSIPSFWKPHLVLAALGVMGCAGEYTSNDFAEGPPGPDKPATAQRGETEPVRNFANCDDLDSGEGSFAGCGNACFDCLARADEDLQSSLVCIYGAACRAYFAQDQDLVEDESVANGNLLGTPDVSLEQADICQGITDACALCLCEMDSQAECIGLCQSG